MAALLVAVCAGFAIAQPADVSGDVTVNVAVNGLWQVNLSTALVDFGTMDVGDNATAAVVATVRTNQKVAWYLKLDKDHDLTHTVDATETIPSANFTYTGSGGAGVWSNGAFNLLPTTAYTATVLERKAAAGIVLTTDYDLTIPGEAVAGDYENVITYTLTATP